MCPIRREQIELPPKAFTRLDIFFHLWKLAQSIYPEYSNTVELTWNKASYSLTIFGWKTSGLLCWVKGEVSILSSGTADSGLRATLHGKDMTYAGQSRHRPLCVCQKAAKESYCDNLDQFAECDWYQFVWITWKSVGRSTISRVYLVPSAYHNNRTDSVRCERQTGPEVNG